MSYFSRINISTKMVEVVDNRGNVRHEVPENELTLVYKALGEVINYPLTITKVRNLEPSDFKEPLKRKTIRTF